MPNLDWSNVHADADFEYNDFLNRMWTEFEHRDTVTLEHLRYSQRRWVVNGHDTVADIDLLRMLDEVLLRRLATTLCEGCLGRTGCDMCRPPNWSMSDMYPGYDDGADAHFERFGRPEFPNEY